MPELSLSSMKGKKIFTSEGLSVGEVVRFELDPSIWKVRSIVAEVVDTAMEALETEILRGLGIDDPYAIVDEPVG